MNAIDLDLEPLLLDEDASHAVFVLLCRGGTNPGTIRRALERILWETGASRQDASARMLVVAKLRNASQLVQREIDDVSITIDVSNIPVLREPIYRAAREGLEQGIEQGRSAGMADLFVAQLFTAFGELPDDVVARIGELPTVHLMELAIDIGDIDLMNRLRESLGLPVDAVPSTVPKP